MRYQFTAVANAISAVVPYGSMEEIATLPGVEQVCPVGVRDLPDRALSHDHHHRRHGGKLRDLGERVHRRRDAHCGGDTGLDLDHPPLTRQLTTMPWLGGELGSAWISRKFAQVLPRPTIAQDGLSRRADLTADTAWPSATTMWTETWILPTITTAPGTTAPTCPALPQPTAMFQRRWLWPPQPRRCWFAAWPRGPTAGDESVW